jgi:allantoinase
MAYDLILRNGRLPGGSRNDIAVRDGRIADLGSALAGSAEREVDASGLWILPGLIDTHVHFNEPGRTTWEGIWTGSGACAAGGVTTFADMPLNSSPPVTSVVSFHRKKESLLKSSRVNFAIWGGWVPGNEAELPLLADAGVIGFKAFLCNSGLDEFPPVPIGRLREGMARIAETGRRLALHAEHPDRLLATGPTPAEWSASRPVEAELDAIHTILEASSPTGCPVQIVHVSSLRCAQLVHRAREQGIDAICETCPHYLVLTREDTAKLGSVAKCAPPLRGEQERAALWTALEQGIIQTIGSDHSPCPPEMKAGDFQSAWGGISGVQSGLSLLHTLQPDWLPRFVEAMSEMPAALFRIPGKGSIAVGADADLVLFDPEEEFRIEQNDLLYRHQQSPYIGRPCRGRIRETILKGRTVFEGKRVTDDARGTWVRPESP